MTIAGTEIAERVSVVIPAYKAGSTICRAIDSVLSQTHPATEIIVVDDGSPDDQAHVVGQTYGTRVILIRQPNGRTAKARNTGIDRATGDFIAFLDADDYWEPEKLQRQLQVFRNHPEVGLVAGLAYQELPGKVRSVGALSASGRARYDRVLRVTGQDAFALATMIWTGMVMIRSEVVGGERFVSGLEPAEDRDFWVRIVNKHPAYLLSEPLATAVLEEGSISRSNIDADCGSMMNVVNRHSDLLGGLGLRKWRSHTLYRWAANDPSPPSAIPRLVQSMATWPFPYTGIPRAQRLGRAKRLVVLLAKATGLRA